LGQIKNGPAQTKVKIMKLIKLSALLVLALAVSLGTTGCKKKNHSITQIPNTKPRVGETGPGYDNNNTRPVNVGDGGVGTQPFSGIPTSPLDPSNLIQDRARFAPFTVHFAFDSASVKSSEQGKISAVAAELKNNPGLMVIIEGHCDERGTEGYNQALGEKRALTLREELVKLGVNSDHVFTKSLGEMQPAVDGHNEAAWSANRRGEFIAGTPK
jgi:peptidoglycan-associated lipoprotein